MLEGFVTVSNEKKAEADKLHTIGRSRSPFVENITFKVTGWSYQQAVEVGKKVAEDAKANPGLTTDLKTGIDKDNKDTFAFIFISMFTRVKMDRTGKVLEPEGDVNKLIMKILNENFQKSDGEILSLCYEALKDKEIIVKRKFYQAEYDGRPYPASFPNFYFKK